MKRDTFLVCIIAPLALLAWYFYEVFMAKRFTDSDKWKKKWFRKLKPEHKVFWEYLRDNCDNAGIWDIDFELAELLIGCELNEKEIRDVFSKQYIELTEDKWFLIDFVEWQYNCSIKELLFSISSHNAIQLSVRKFQ